MSAGSSPHLTDWQSQDTQFTECHDATHPFYPPETYMRETSELRIKSTPPLAFLVPPEVPIGDIQTRDAAHPMFLS
ncbi:hypothetical protein P691DRAFT_767830 [Macrolepiota fuliginosa MF-IS2]|uniref:Uncharacterized protein n=1 Tax=Macrolepiota fuliginosa MF-IS2 TaxID=1400762 RepID=A0A9P5WZ37_9AGAR|nr:hypothetical protein P691DRAFT_767830 [Macrolepiota fuliginosa MF-IS2]